MAIIPRNLLQDDGEDPRPAPYRVLFDSDPEELVKITETPTRMILPMVRMALINEASKTTGKRNKESLISVFMRNFDSRMISRDRKGRIEAVQLLQNRRMDDEGSEDIPL